MPSCAFLNKLFVALLIVAASADSAASADRLPRQRQMKSRIKNLGPACKREVRVVEDAMAAADNVAPIWFELKTTRRKRGREPYITAECLFSGAEAFRATCRRKSGKLRFSNKYGLTVPKISPPGVRTQRRDRSTVNAAAVGTALCPNFCKVGETGGCKYLEIAFPNNTLAQVLVYEDWLQDFCDGFGVSREAVTGFRLGEIQPDGSLILLVGFNSADVGQKVLEATSTPTGGFVYESVTFLAVQKALVGAPPPPPPPPGAPPPPPIVINDVVRPTEYEAYAVATNSQTVLEYDDIFATGPDDAAPGWSYTDDSSNPKLTLPGYIAGSLDTAVTLGDITNLWYRVKYYATTSQTGTYLPFFNLYTTAAAPMYRVWHESRQTFDSGGRLSADVSGTYFTMYTNSTPVHLSGNGDTFGLLFPTTSDVNQCGDVSNPQNRCCGGTTCGPQLPQEEVFYYVLSTNSAAGGDDYRFVLVEMGMSLGNKDYRIVYEPAI